MLKGVKRTWPPTIPKENCFDALWSHLVTGSKSIASELCRVNPAAVNRNSTESGQLSSRDNCFLVSKPQHFPPLCPVPKLSLLSLSGWSAVWPHCRRCCRVGQTHIQSWLDCSHRCSTISLCYQIQWVLLVCAFWYSEYYRSVLSDTVSMCGTSKGKEKTVCGFIPNGCCVVEIKWKCSV